MKARNNSGNKERNTACSRRVAAVLLSMLMLLSVVMLTAAQVSAAPTQAAQARTGTAKKTVIVLDPGHGGTQGDDLGAVYGQYAEKAMTLHLANLVKAELELYDNVEVYLTREADVPVSIYQRVQFAKAKNADLLYSIHFNVAPEHDRTGSEVYITADPAFHDQAAALAEAQLSNLTFFANIPRRGIFTRVGSNGDYYGIIRYATQAGMPAVIVEHLFIDQAPDRKLMEQENIYLKLAHADATTIAMHQKLKSTRLGIDFSNIVLVPGVSTESDLWKYSR